MLDSGVPGDAAGVPVRPVAAVSPHAQSAAAVLALLEVTADGLSSAEAVRRRQRFGPNALPEQERQSLLMVFLRQFKSPLIYLLFVAAAFAFAMGERTDALVVFSVVLLNSIIGAFQEGRAERSMQALRRMSGLKVNALRDGQVLELEARELVPGDVLVLAAGEGIGADARLLDCASLEVSEAALTGESLPVAKLTAIVAQDTALADRSNMVYAGTHLTAGRGRAVVVAIGSNTEVGGIAMLTATTEEPRTPLERRIEQFGRYLVGAAIGMFFIVLLAGLARGLAPSSILMVAISQVVSMVPEGLPVAVTIALAVGMQRMAARKAIVRRLGAVESLGSTTVICTDKTGTLTRNEMTVTRVELPGGRALEVSGAGYSGGGSLLEAGQELGWGTDPGLDLLLEGAVLCNDAHLPQPGESASQVRAVGDPTELALLALARKGGVDIADLRRRCPRRSEIPFDAESKMMATLHDRPEGGRLVFLKGAPEAVLDLCGARRRGSVVEPLDASGRAGILTALESMGSDALRVLAIAVAVPDGSGRPFKYSSLRGQAVFLGLVGQFDPPREEAAESVARCRTAGIRTVMVTGDHKLTGVAIARRLGIARDNDLALDGRELEAIDEPGLRRLLPRVTVFARVRPDQKLRIVQALQENGEVVAMTGDGVNDAPALARAEVGVAMGISGTEVAKEAADIVVTDDNFASIVDAVEQGRVAYHNLKKVILLLLSTGLAEVVVLLVALLLGYPLPFAAVQILWNNVVTEGTIALNLVLEPREGDEMRRPPIPRDEPILTRAMLGRMLMMSAAIAVSTLGFFAWRLHQGVPFAQAQTACFTLLAVCEWFNVLNCRSETRSALRPRLLANPWLLGGLVISNLLQMAVVFIPAFNRVFHTVPLPLSEVFAIGAIASLVLWVEEARKFVARRRVRLASAT